MEASEMKRFKQLEEENNKLKQMYANLALDLEAAKYLIEKKVVTPCIKKSIAKELIEELGKSKFYA
jgi:putative transposase